MNRLILPFFLFFCVMSPLLKAQSLGQFPSKNSYGRNNLTINDIKGSPYLDSEYKAGTVMTFDDILYKDIPLRYNCFDDIFEFKKDNVSYDLKPKEKIKRVAFGGKVFGYREFETNGGSDKSFCEILAEGKAVLCVRFSVKFYEPEPLQGFADPKPARFDDFSETYYISVNNSPAKKFSNSKKLLEMFGDKQKDVDGYMSKQKLSVKKLEDLKKIVTYYNTL